MTVSGAWVVTARTMTGARSRTGAAVGLPPGPPTVGWTMGAVLVGAGEGACRSEVSGNRGAPGVGEGEGSVVGATVAEVTSSTDKALPVR